MPSSLFLRSVVCTDGDTSSPSPVLRIHGDFVLFVTSESMECFEFILDARFQLIVVTGLFI